MLRNATTLTWFVVAVAMLLAGGCGGGGSSSDGTMADATPSIGHFIDSPVQGLRYSTPGYSGTTGTSGEFSYIPGNEVTFYVGELVLGRGLGQEVVFPSDLTVAAQYPFDAGLNIARFLQSIDNDGNPDNGISITADLAAELDRLVAAGLQVEFDRDTDDFAADPGLADLLVALDPLTSAETSRLISCAEALAHLAESLCAYNPAPSFVIDASGGDGPVAGGSASATQAIQITKMPGSNPVEILNDIPFSEDFGRTTSVSSELGGNPLAIFDNQRIEFFDPAVDTPPAAGTRYMLKSPYNLGSGNVYDGKIYTSDGDGEFADEPPVTSLVVNPGATLTLGLNTGSSTFLVIDNALVIYGTLTVDDVDAGQRGGFECDAKEVYNGGGTIALHGTQPGQSGGELLVYSQTVLVNSGLIATYGADNDAGDAGQGGVIYFEIYAGRFENSGALDSHGGHASGSSGSGGAGGAMTIVPQYALHSAGSFNARGGDGYFAGGAGGALELTVWVEGPVINRGALDTSGGDSETGPGGHGGGITLLARGEHLSSNAALVSRGGRTHSDATAGAGGAIALQTTESTTTAAGSLWLSGNIDVSGGDATGTILGSGGAGGGVSVEVDTIASVASPNPRQLKLMGYERLAAKGGASVLLGGNGGKIYIEGSDGGIVNEAVPDISGGDADPLVAGSTGGDGGEVLYGHNSDAPFTTLPAERSGGDGETPGSDGIVMHMSSVGFSFP